MSLRCSLDFVRTIALLVLVAAAMPASSADGQPANPPVASDADDASAHFRVDMHAERDGQRYVMRRYVDGPRSRMEAEVDGQKMVIIDLGDAQGTTYMLMPTMKRAMKSSTASLQANSGGGNDGTPTPEQAEAAVELLGTERLGGKTAEKYRVTMPEGTGLMWIEASTQLPLRMEAEGMAVEMKDYNFSRPSRELFEVPKGYDLLDMDQMLKSAGGVGGANVGSLQSLVAGMVGGQAGDGRHAGWAWRDARTQRDGWARHGRWAWRHDRRPWRAAGWPVRRPAGRRDWRRTGRPYRCDGGPISGPAYRSETRTTRRKGARAEVDTPCSHVAVSDGPYHGAARDLSFCEGDA